MESLPTNDDVIVAENVVAENVSESNYPTAAAVDPPTDTKTNRKKKKKSGAFGLFKAALFMLRKSRGEKPGAKTNLAPKLEGEAENNPNPNWTKLVDSVRPLHAQETARSPPTSLAPAPEKYDIREIIPKRGGMSKFASASNLLDIQPASPASSSSSKRGGMSKYASASSLLDLDNSSEEEGDPDEVFDALTGDEMIDAKAEAFIAQFYKQMQVQRTVKTHRHQHHHRPNGHNLSLGI